MSIIFIIIVVFIGILYANITKSYPPKKKKAAKDLYMLSLLIMIVCFFGFGYSARPIMISSFSFSIVILSILIILKIVKKREKTASDIQKPAIKREEGTPTKFSPLTAKECFSCGNTMLSNEKCCRYCGNPNPEYKGK